MKADESLEQIFKVQAGKLEESYARLKQVMPSYFFKSVSTEDLAAILPMAAELENKSGIQMIERPDRILMVYLKSETCNPVCTSRFFAGKRILRSIIHESAPLDGSGGIIVIEQITKDVPGPEMKPLFSSGQIEAEYRKFYERLPENLKETAESICWRDVEDLDLERIAKRLRLVCEVRKRDYSLTEIENVGGNEYRITMAVAVVARSEGYYAQTLEQLEASGFKVTRSYLRNFTAGGAPDDFRRKAVRVNTYYIVPVKPGADAPEKMINLKRELNELAWSPQFDLFEWELLVRNEFCCASVNLLRAASEFVHSQLSFVDRNAYSLPEIQRFMATYPAVLRRLADAFESKFHPDGPSLDFGKVIQEVREEIANINSGMAEKDAKVKVVLSSVTDFICCILKSNYYSEKKTALAFGLDPAFMRHYESISESYGKAFPPERPYGVFFFWRRNVSGFQIRFSEIARGGWRTVAPKPVKSLLESGDSFEQARSELFRECFVLANTQHKKNKDIYEGGSKLVTLLKVTGEFDFKTELWAAQRAVFEAFLQLVNYGADGKLRDGKIVDFTNRADIIEIGPDENMSDEMISWMGDRAGEDGYTLGSGVISGKVDTGINHKHYGVTSFGVFQYLLRTLQYLKINPAHDDFSIKLSGGPYGDVAGNMIKLLNAEDGTGGYRMPGLRIVAVTDGPAAIFDPAGIDRRELSRLVHSANLDSFDPAKLRGEGAFMIFNQPDGDSRYPMASVSGGKLRRAMIARDDFMRMFQANICHEADVFIPCGGRPQTINAGNYGLYAPDGKPSSKAIVEGANSFITPEARLALQKLGVVIVKDSSANKCGVITSSYEILSGLLLDKNEFSAIHPELVAEIMDRLAFCARREAEWLFHEFELRRSVPMTELSDQLADRINEYKQQLFTMLDSHPELVTDGVIFAHLPPLFRKKFADRLHRIPPVYRKAIAAVELSLRIVFRKKLSLEEDVRQIVSSIG